MQQAILPELVLCVNVKIPTKELVDSFSKISAAEMLPSRPQAKMTLKLSNWELLLKYAVS